MAHIIELLRVKNGQMRGSQRYKCKNCDYNFIPGDKRVKYGIQDRLKVMKLYLENCGIRKIERLKGINNRQISLWISSMASEIRSHIKKHFESVKSIKDI